MKQFILNMHWIESPWFLAFWIIVGVAAILSAMKLIRDAIHRRRLERETKARREGKLSKYADKNFIS